MPPFHLSVEMFDTQPIMTKSQSNIELIEFVVSQFETVPK